MSLDKLKKRIKNKEALIAVIGLGYVGLPVACSFARAGFQVTGIDINKERVNKINSGISPIEGIEPGLPELIAEVTKSGKLDASTEYITLRNCDVVLISVETPVDSDNKPRYRALRACLKSLGKVLKNGALVIIESTIAPGTVNKIVVPILEESGNRKVNKDFYLGHCPERVMPGKLLANLTNVSRVVGGMTPDTAEIMLAVYRNIIPEADLDPTDCITAELVKTAENTYRDVQIAFANEVAIICEAVGGDIWKVRELVNKSPGRQMLMPGSGVGGHCIPKDPWLLAHGVDETDIALRIIPAARAVNDSMPIHILDLLEHGLDGISIKIKHAQILVLGYAYLENSDDVRNSPSAFLVEKLIAKGAKVAIHDPYVSEFEGDLLAMAKNCDAAVLMVKHREYLELSLQKLADALKTPVVIDGRGAYYGDAAKDKIAYYGVGLGR